MDVPHRCRNFERLREWGKEHRLMEELDYPTEVVDDLVVAGL